MTIFGAGLVCTGSAVISDRVFNAGIALPTGTLLMVGAFMMGLTQTPLLSPKPRWRKAVVGAEFICTVVAALFLIGVICV